MRAHFKEIWLFDCFTASLAFLLSNLVVFWIIACWSMGSLAPLFQCDAQPLHCLVVSILGLMFTPFFLAHHLWLAAYPVPCLLQAIAAQDRIGWLPFFKGCSALVNGLVYKKLTLSGSVNTTHTGKRWATSLEVKLWKVAWDLWDHCNQVKRQVEMAQDITCHNAIMLAICSEYSFPHSGLPQWDWRLFKPPLLSTLLRSLHYTWMPGYSRSKLHAQ